MSSSWAADRSGSDICNSASDAINSEELCLETKVAKWTKWQRFSEQVEGVPDSRKTRHFYCCRKENHKNWRKESSRDSGRWQMSYNAIFQVAGSSLAYTEGPRRLLLGNWNLLDSRQVIRYLQLLQHFPTKKKKAKTFLLAPPSSTGCKASQYDRLGLFPLAITKINSEFSDKNSMEISQLR